jgi:hypothetical protein
MSTLLPRNTLQTHATGAHYHHLIHLTRMHFSFPNSEQINPKDPSLAEVSQTGDNKAFAFLLSSY